MSVLQIDNNKLTNARFASVYETMRDHEDDDNAIKVADLYEKYLNNEFVICFSGHFSAGKSSIINYLLEKDVLPKSPIPTSANIVKITSGEGAAKVFFKNDEAVKYQEPYDIDVIKEYCMDRDTIQQIEISTKEAILPAHAALFDSPGIDAADDADRLMTESAIHLIDLLFYVMDYNHVQSEVNLYFLQEMQKQSIPIYIIINQVDKHDEKELSFSEYEDRIKQTFDQWGIHPREIYYTTVTEADHSHNQLEVLKRDVFELLRVQPGIHDRVIHAMEALIYHHQSFLKSKYETASEDSYSALNDAEMKEAAKLQKALSSINERYDEFYQAYNEEVQTTLKNAYIMPRNLRDLAESFLLSQEKDFKVGLFNAKKKTQEEQNLRLEQFLSALNQTVETTIQWKLREKVISLLQEYQVAEESILEKVQNLSIPIIDEDVFAHLKKGASVNGNYILNYTNDISTAIKNKYRSALNRLWSSISQHAKNKFDDERLQIETSLENYTDRIASMEKIQSLHEELSKKQAYVMAQWEHPELSEDNIRQLELILTEKNQLKLEEMPEKLKEEQHTKIIAEESKQEQKHTSVNITTITTAIDQVLNEISGMSGFQSIINDLTSKKDRLENRELTIALFGTFSAGKSSFANALFGKQILPVSPNPTTAVINRISPITENRQHGTVNISIKNEAELISDLREITKHIIDKQMDLAGWIEWIKQEHIHEHEDLTRTYQSYLAALIAGYDAQKTEIGKTITISLHEFPDFVTDEKKACFIKEVDLFYDCALTRKGITLVDTPGADSVNARHTNVAFDYIKEADAILYVTYFNHAITSGDRDFLMQLGRVKEAFEMDKMFFIVNASDLAENERELQLVVQYVTDQLLKFGVRNPKIYPVSSKKSLEDKLSSQSLNDEMKYFEASFYSFIEEDLVALTAETAIWDMNRAQKALDSFIHSSELNESERQDKLNQLKKEKEKCRLLIEQTNMNVFKERLTDRIDRQLHFVLERLYIRFHDMFTEFFNPSTINASGKQAYKQLETSRNKFIDYTGYELLQEIRAVAIRIEAYLKDMLKEANELNQQDLQVVNDIFILPSLHDADIVTPAFKQAFMEMDLNIFNKPLKIFKNMRSFFEQNERENMKNAFYDVLKPYAEKYLQEANQLMKESYQEQWEAHIDTMKTRIKQEITIIVDEQIRIMTTTVDIKDLQKRSNHIKGTMEMLR